jgi:hypothetical protein
MVKKSTFILLLVLIAGFNLKYISFAQVAENGVSENQEMQERGLEKKINREEIRDLRQVQRQELREERQESRVQMMDQRPTMPGGKTKGMLISCEKLKSALQKRIDQFQKSGEKRAQALSNIEKSIQSRIETLKIQQKDVSLVESNFENYKSLVSSFAIERVNTVSKLREVLDMSCQDGSDETSLSTKKDFIQAIKEVNAITRSNVQKNTEIINYLRANVLGEIKKLVNS